MDTNAGAAQRLERFPPRAASSDLAPQGLWRIKFRLASCLGTTAAGTRGLPYAAPLPPPVTAMSIHKAIDQIVETFIPEMERISKMNESEEQKERHYKAWLRATLQKFADDVRDIEKRNTAERPRDNDAA